MKIIIRNTDSVVIHAGENLILTETGVTGDGWADDNFTIANATIADATLPDNFTGAAFSYIGGVWAVVDQAAYDFALAMLSKPHALIALTTTKEAKNTQINLWRAEANQTVFPHLGKHIACDALSRSDIDAVAGSVSLTGAFPVGFPGAWKYTDNTYLMLPDVQAFKEMYASMTQAGTVNFARSQTLKTALAAATTLAEVNALSWEE